MLLGCQMGQKLDLIYKPSLMGRIKREIFVSVYERIFMGKDCPKMV